MRVRLRVVASNKQRPRKMAAEPSRTRRHAWELCPQSRTNRVVFASLCPWLHDDCSCKPRPQEASTEASRLFAASRSAESPAFGAAVGQRPKRPSRGLQRPKRPLRRHEDEGERLASAAWLLESRGFARTTALPSAARMTSSRTAWAWLAAQSYADKPPSTGFWPCRACQAFGVRAGDLDFGLSAESAKPCLE